MTTDCMTDRAYLAGELRRWGEIVKLSAPKK